MWEELRGPDAGPGIAVRNVSQWYGGQQVLRGVSFDAPAGQITSLMGASGVGKTTTVKLVVGLLAPDSGEVWIGGQALSAATPAELGRVQAGFGTMLQGGDAGLFGSMTVRENIRFAVDTEPGLSARKRSERVDEWLDLVGLTSSADHRPEALSVGMRRRAALARALAPDKPFVVLDDLEGGVDGVRTSLLCDLLLRVAAERSATFLITTHNPEVSLRVADHVVLLDRGSVAAEGPATSVLAAGATAAVPGSARAQHGAVAQPPPAPPAAGRSARLWVLSLLVLVVVAVFVAVLAAQLGSHERVLSPY